MEAKKVKLQTPAEALNKAERQKQLYLKSLDKEHLLFILRNVQPNTNHTSQSTGQLRAAILNFSHKPSHTAVDLVADFKVQGVKGRCAYLLRPTYLPHPSFFFWVDITQCCCSQVVFDFWNNPLQRNRLVHLCPWALCVLCSETSFALDVVDMRTRTANATPLHTLYSLGMYHQLYTILKQEDALQTHSDWQHDWQSLCFRHLDVKTRHACQLFAVDRILQDLFDRVRALNFVQLSPKTQEAYLRETVGKYSALIKSAQELLLTQTQ